MRLRSRWDFYRHAATLAALTAPPGADAAGQQRLRASLPPPLRVRPEPGDLVLLCVQRPHAVQGFPLGERASLQSFITHKAGEPLRLES